ncbi:MAG TPA: 3-keto-5-aminohexanoate cleavage protein [Acidimicrobiales bacterium]|nr:3-keto-5-aminohexanoate cleavage protein [Acidimicrobiales bacterium]
MTLGQDGKICIEVAPNELISKTVNPNVPYLPSEIVPEVIACAREGAAVVHWHARYDDGSQAWNDESLYREAIEGIACDANVVMYPSYFHADFSHVWGLCDNPPKGALMEVAPFDVFQHVGRTIWDAQAGRLRSRPFGGVRTAGDQGSEVLNEIRRRELKASVATYEIGDIRWLYLAARQGLIDQPVNVKIFLSDQMLVGPFPTNEAIEFVLSQWPSDVDAELTLGGVLLSDPDVAMRLVNIAIEQRVNVRVGIGDSAWAYPTSTSSELVARATELIYRAGLSVATPDDVRRRLNLAAAPVAE